MQLLQCVDGVSGPASWGSYDAPDEGLSSCWAERVWRQLGLVAARKVSQQPGHVHAALVHASCLPPERSLTRPRLVRLPPPLVVGQLQLGSYQLDHILAVRLGEPLASSKLSTVTFAKSVYQV